MGPKRGFSGIIKNHCVDLSDFLRKVTLSSQAKNRAKRLGPRISFLKLYKNLKLTQMTFLGKICTRRF